MHQLDSISAIGKLFIVNNVSDEVVGGVSVLSAGVLGQAVVQVDVPEMLHSLSNNEPILLNIAHK